MIDIEFKPLRTHPERWGPAAGVLRPASGFRATWETTIADLEHEARQLDATDVLLQVDVDDSARRVSGMIRVDARARHPGVILTLATPEWGTLVYDTDRFPTWQENFRAVVLTLFDLRRMDRYGTASRGQQYAGWAQLGSGLAMESGLTPGEAARLLAAAATDGGGRLGGGAPVQARDLNCRTNILSAYGAAVLATHPDQGGTDEAFVQITAARDVLLAQLPPD